MYNVNILTNHELQMYWKYLPFFKEVFAICADDLEMTRSPEFSFCRVTDLKIYRL